MVAVPIDGGVCGMMVEAVAGTCVAVSGAVSNCEQCRDAFVLNHITIYRFAAALCTACQTFGFRG